MRIPAPPCAPRLIRECWACVPMLPLRMRRCGVAWPCWSINSRKFRTGWKSRKAERGNVCVCQVCRWGVCQLWACCAPSPTHIVTNGTCTVCVHPHQQPRSLLDTSACALAPLCLLASLVVLHLREWCVGVRRPGPQSVARGLRHLSEPSMCPLSVCLRAPAVPCVVPHLCRGAQTLGAFCN